MNVLIVESKRHLAELWRRALERLGAHVDIVSSQDQAADMAAAETYHIVVLDLILNEGSAFAVADFMNYRQPDAQVIFVTNTSFFFGWINLSIVFQCLRLCSKRNGARRFGRNYRTLRGQPSQ